MSSSPARRCDGGTLATKNGGVIETVAGNGRLVGTVSAVNNTGSFLVNNSTDLFLDGVINNTGTITENSTGNTTQIIIEDSTVTLTGGGQLVMSNSSANYISGNNAGFQLVNVNNTISGAGNLGNNSVTLINQAKGVIDANQSTTLFVQTQNLVSNAGLMEATVGGTLQFGSTNVNNTGGTILARAGTVDLTNSTIFGGTIATQNGGVIQSVVGNAAIDGITFGAVTLNGTLTVDNSTILFLAGTINDKGSTFLEAGATNTTQIQLASNTVTLQGGGSLVMSNSQNNYLQSLNGGNFQEQLVNVDNTISGTGNIQNLTLINEAGGVVNANNAAISGSDGILTIAMGSGYVSNAGLIEDTGTAGLAINSTNIYQTATGVIAANGAGSNVDLNSSNIVGGTLSTSGGGVIQTTSGISQLDGINSRRDHEQGQLPDQRQHVPERRRRPEQYRDDERDLERQHDRVPSQFLGGDAAGRRLRQSFGQRQQLYSRRLFDLADTGQRRQHHHRSRSDRRRRHAAQQQRQNRGDRHGKSAHHQRGRQQLRHQQCRGSLGRCRRRGAPTHQRLLYQQRYRRGPQRQFGDLHVVRIQLQHVRHRYPDRRHMGGGSGTISMTGGSLVTDAANLILSGTTSVIQVGNGSSFTPIETTLTTIAAGGSLAIEGGRVYTTTLALSDSGTISLAGTGSALAAASLAINKGGAALGQRDR